MYRGRDLPPPSGGVPPASRFEILWTGNPQALASAPLGGVCSCLNPCPILKIVRTHFAACGGEEAPRENERLRREPDNFKFE